MELLTYERGEGDALFWGCKSLTEVNIPSQIDMLYGTFYDCDSLEQFTVSDSVTSLIDTFKDCNRLVKVTVGRNVKTIEGAFYSCTALTSVVFKDGVESVQSEWGFGSHSDCWNELVCPASMTSLSMNGFFGSNINKVVVLNPNMELLFYSNYIYDNLAKQMTIYCQRDSFVEWQAREKGFGVAYLD